MERKRVPDEWVGRAVKVGVRTRKGGLYWAVGWLHGVTDDEICISPTHPLDEPTPRSYSWSSVEGVRPLRDDAGGHR